jgi:hypothetical protein
MKNINYLLLLILLISFTSCADTVEVQECLTGDPDGFWWGLWHGMTLPISFFGSLVSDDIAMFSVNNNGGWYNFGIFLGIGGLGGAASSSGK